MQVRDVMQKDIISIEQGMSVKDAALLLMNNKITGAPVIDDNENLIGIVSEKDIFKMLYPDYHEIYSLVKKETDADIEKSVADAKNKKITDIMTKDVLTVNSNDSTVKVGAMMIIKNINRVLVLDNKKLVGIVSRKDIYSNTFKGALEN